MEWLSILRINRIFYLSLAVSRCYKRLVLPISAQRNSSKLLEMRKASFETWIEKFESCKHVFPKMTGGKESETNSCVVMCEFLLHFPIQ
ncbi:hypothetical protein CEXT_656921 [Caerostris extrusa]|uniref:Uncharacterized protein n=1 Tax=Caerostris extrusa TaxID=172846 RepID=A0AAV4TBS1_CAEEX|nr:hypothetical protein CEXT_656921 [Caerostris extrusa]